MGKVIVPIKLTNLFDLAFQKRGVSKARPRQGGLNFPGRSIMSWIVVTGGRRTL